MEGLLEQKLGKVKTVNVTQYPTENEFGKASFSFRNEYSIFD